MILKVGKTFDRAGQRYRAGDAPPPDLDKATLQHYLRHGMLVEVAPAVPARRSRSTAPQHQPAPKPAAPQNTGTAAPEETGTAIAPQEAQQPAPAEAQAQGAAPQAT